MNCSVPPTVVLGFKGVIAMDVKVASVTVKFARLEVMASFVAVMMVLPRPCPVARPVMLIDAFVMSVDAHVAVAVRSLVVPFE